MYTIYSILALCIALGLYFDLSYCGFGQPRHVLVHIVRGIAGGGTYGVVLGCLAAYGVAYLLPTHIVTSLPVPVISLTPVDQSRPFVLSRSSGDGMKVSVGCGNTAGCEAEVSAPGPAFVIIAPDPSLSPDKAFWTTSRQEFNVSAFVRNWAVDPFGSFEHPVVQYFRVPVGTQTGT